MVPLAALVECVVDKLDLARPGHCGSFSARPGILDWSETIHPAMRPLALDPFQSSRQLVYVGVDLPPFLFLS